MDCQDVVNKVDSVSVETIFFDYFDTIVHRNVHPEHIKRLWCKELLDHFRINKTVDELYQVRNELETVLCKRNLELGFDQEFSALELYNVMYNALSLEQIVCSDDFINTALSIEESIEIREQYIDTNVVSAIKELSKTKRIFIVSDFYLPKDSFYKFVEAHCLAEFIEGIFVSSEFLLKKSSGRLFDLLIEKHGFIPSNIAHLGDNKLADYDMPLSKGFNAFYLPFEHASYSKSWNTHSDRRHLNKELASEVSGDYSWFSLALYLFTAKLWRSLVMEKQTKVFFLAREGEFLKRIFDHYSQKRCGGSLLKSEYLKISRKSAYLPSLKKELELESFSAIANQYSNISPIGFLKTLNLYDELSTEATLEPLLKDDVVEEFFNSSIYRELRSSKVFKEAYSRKRAEQLSNLNRYLDKLGKDSVNTINLVDVGWKGSIQNFLRNILPDDKKLAGYYVGLMPQASRAIDNKKFGLLFDKLDHTLYKGFMFAESTALFETLLSASHGSTKSYDKDGPLIENNETELTIYSNVISPIQEKMFEDFDKIDSIVSKYSFDIEDLAEFVEESYLAGISAPKDSEVDSFSKIQHFENFALYTFSTMDDENRKSFLEKFRREPVVTLGQQWWPAYTLKKNKLNLLSRAYQLFKKYQLVKFKNKNKGKNIGKSANTADFDALKAELKRVKGDLAFVENRVEEFKVAMDNQTRMIDERDAYIRDLEERINNG